MKIFFICILFMIGCEKQKIIQLSPAIKNDSSVYYFHTEVENIDYGASGQWILANEVFDQYNKWYDDQHSHDFDGLGYYPPFNPYIIPEEKVKQDNTYIKVKTH